MWVNDMPHWWRWQETRKKEKEKGKRRWKSRLSVIFAFPVRGGDYWSFLPPSSLKETHTYADGNRRWSIKPKATAGNWRNDRLFASASCSCHSFRVVYKRYSPQTSSKYKPGKKRARSMLYELWLPAESNCTWSLQIIVNRPPTARRTREARRVQFIQKRNRNAINPMRFEAYNN